MTGRPSAAARRGRRGVVVRGAAVLAMMAGLLMAAGGVARADEEMPREANLLVLQSVALIANEAPKDVVVERIQDALAAPDQSGTDAAKVRQALALARSGGPTGLQQAREDLLGAIDIRFATGYGEIPRPGQVGHDQSPYATGAQTGTTAVLDELKPARGVSDAGDAVLLTLAVLAVVAGLLLARRWRPHDTIRQLRHQIAEPERAR